jgi:hypothetical protein
MKSPRLSKLFDPIWAALPCIEYGATGERADSPPLKTRLASKRCS